MFDGATIKPCPDILGIEKADRRLPRSKYAHSWDL